MPSLCSYFFLCWSSFFFQDRMYFHQQFSPVVLRFFLPFYATFFSFSWIHDVGRRYSIKLHKDQVTNLTLNHSVSCHSLQQTINSVAGWGKKYKKNVAGRIVYTWCYFNFYQHSQTIPECIILIFYFATDTATFSKYYLSRAKGTNFFIVCDHINEKKFSYLHTYLKQYRRE